MCLSDNPTTLLHHTQTKCHHRHHRSTRATTGLLLISPSPSPSSPPAPLPSSPPGPAGDHNQHIQPRENNPVTHRLPHRHPTPIHLSPHMTTTFFV
ncbi:extensin precursor [Iris pallida]|uniref:Extensin n=1 Tax=Iris pallida TaxID=29817 RepID=A0AAX6I130_IRIPA|nr:extensin precursor [Iris pallida]